MNKRQLKRITPLDKEGSPIDGVLEEFPQVHKIIDMANKRTHRYILEVITAYSGLSLHDALAGAYLQGMEDAIICLERNSHD